MSRYDSAYPTREAHLIQRRVLRRIRACVTAALSAAVMSTAFCAEEIEWSDLQPPAPPPMANPFADLSDDRVEALRELAVSLELEARGLPITPAGLQRRAALRQQLRDKGVDADALLARRRELVAQRRAAAEAAEPALEGRELRLRGYVLPIVTEGRLATEFLFVPWVGACSHASTPPPNQIVLVRPQQPVAVSGPYEAAWVSGVARLQATVTSIQLVDGTLNVRSAYAIDDAAVVPATAASGR